MEGLGVLIIIFFAAFIMEYFDSGIGMGYGTVLSPLGLALGLDPLLIVPSVLFSQAMGGIFATIFHQFFRNANFKPITKSTDVGYVTQKVKEYGFCQSIKIGLTRDFKIAFLIILLGVVATIVAAFVAVSIPKFYLNLYIGILVIVIGILLLSGKAFKFSWKKMIGIGVLASFNKGISGGGFGPVTTGGQVMAGNFHKSAIACTTFAEIPICLIGFLIYALTKGNIDWQIIGVMSLGAVLSTPLGAFTTKRMNEKMIKVIMGGVILLLGIWTVFKLFT